MKKDYLLTEKCTDIKINNAITVHTKNIEYYICLRSFVYENELYYSVECINNNCLIWDGEYTDWATAYAAYQACCIRKLNIDYEE